MLYQLRLLDSSKGVNDLNDTEVDVVSAHLFANCHAFKTPTARGAPLTLDEIKELVRQCRVMELQNPNMHTGKRRRQKLVNTESLGASRRPVPAVVDGRLAPTEGAADASEAKTDIIARTAEDAAIGMVYRRGQVDTFCTLILSGVLEIHAGADNFHAEAHRFEILATSALTSPAGTYSPDFSAYIKSDVVRCLRISNAQFQTALGFPPEQVPTRHRTGSTASTGGRRPSHTAGAGAGVGAGAGAGVGTAAASAPGPVTVPVTVPAAGSAPAPGAGTATVKAVAAIIGTTSNGAPHVGAAKDPSGIVVEVDGLKPAPTPSPTLDESTRGSSSSAAATLSNLITAAVQVQQNQNAAITSAAEPTVTTRPAGDEGDAGNVV